jgi:very-short-patch-repair endonuclease
MRYHQVGLLRTLAKRMRQAPTGAEHTVWAELRNRRCLGYRFKRQVVIEGLIVDFYCRELRLVIELDGAVHRTREGRQRDLARDAHLRSCGIHVFHLQNEQASRTRLCAILTEFIRRSPSPLAGEGVRG